MSEIVIIKPKKNSKKFFSTARQFQKSVDSQGKTIEVEAGAFNGERFPNSRQMFRPVWSFSKRRWLIKGFETNSEELNKLVSKCKFKHPKNHPSQGKYIDEADVFDLNDPFFNHINLYVRAKEGEVTLDKSNPLDNIILKSIEANEQFQLGDKGSVLSARTKYVIVDNSISNEVKKSSMTSKKEAFRLLDALTFEKKVKIAMSMDLIVGAKIEPDDLDVILFSAIEENKQRIADKMNTIDLFISLCNMDTESLNLKHLVVRAKKAGVLRKTQADGFLLFGNKVGKTLKEVERYFLNDENSDIIARTREAVEDYEK
jgi:hypothetical protein